jgi:hypothetical protein
MRSPRYCVAFAIVALAVGIRGARAGETSGLVATSVATNTGPEQAKACIQLIRSALERVTHLEEDASNQTARLTCLAEKRVKIQGLLELTQSAATRLPRLHDEDDTDQLDAETSRIALACARAEKLALEAENCSSGPAPKSKKHRSDKLAAQDESAQTTTQVAATIQAPSYPIRDERTCVHQDRMALLLGQAMDLGLDGKKTSEAYITEFGKLAIEPLGGWQPGKCTSLDDFCVTVARALNLKIEFPDDPVSYCQALRDDGLPVDTLLPPRSDVNNPPPVLLESEVKSFFAHGYAAPLPTSRRLNHD